MSKNNLIYSPFKKWKKTPVFFNIAFDFFDTFEWLVIIVFNLILGSQGNTQCEMPLIKKNFYEVTWHLNKSHQTLSKSLPHQDFDWCLQHRSPLLHETWTEERALVLFSKAQTWNSSLLLTLFLCLLMKEVLLLQTYRNSFHKSVCN